MNAKSLDVLIHKLKMCKTNLDAVQSNLYHVEGQGKGGAVRWTEVVVEYLSDIVKELENEQQNTKSLKIHQEKIANIARSLRYGYISGYDSIWNLSAAHDVLISELELKRIADLVEEGHVYGSNPTWSLTIGD